MKHNTEAPIVIIGAGLSGLASARYLKKAGLHVLVLESNTRVGGRVYTDYVQDFTIDAGGQFIASFYTHTLDLIHDLNLEEDLVHIPGIAAVLRSGNLYKMWPDLRVIFTGLISAWSKLLLIKPMFDTLVHWNRLDIHDLQNASSLDTSSVAVYTSRFLNDEILEYIFQPALSGIFYWEPEYISLAMLLLMMKVAVGIRLMTLKHGMGQLPKAMAEGLEIQFGAEVTQVFPDDSGNYLLQYKQDNKTLEILARGVVCSIPANLVPGIFPHLTDKQCSFFQAIKYSENAISVIGINNRHLVDVYGLLFPRREAKHLAIAAVQSAKNPEQLPAGQELLVLYPNGSSGSRLIHQSDDRIVKILKQELQLAGSTYQFGNDEIFQRVYRWPQALPIYEVGYFQRLNDFYRGDIESVNLVFSGDYLGGPFIEGAISSGYRAAIRLLTRLI